MSTPLYDDGQTTLYCGDALTVLRRLPAATARTCVTSPPYWGLRNYEIAGQIGMESSIDDYLERLTDVFREVRRVLRDDGTLWLNMGDAYAGGRCGGNPGTSPHVMQRSNQGSRRGPMPKEDGLKPKDLIGLPWRLAFALQADGWWLRSDIIWAKPNPMPESVTDRPTRAHEYVFLLSKGAHYYYDAEAVREPAKPSSRMKMPAGWATGNGAHTAMAHNQGERIDKQRGHGRRHDGFNDRWDAMTRAEQMALGANKRSVWMVATHGFAGAHFATFPPKLIEPCILAGSAEGDIVLDPFIGSGTTAAVAKRLGRRCVGIDLSERYLREFAVPRCQQQAMFMGGAA